MPFDCLVSTYKHGGSGIIIWRPLASVEGKIDADGYTKVSEKYILPFISNLEQNRSFKKIIPQSIQQKWKDENMLISLPWPVQRPDLNPIEHV